jgi:hypothetical protein
MLIVMFLLEFFIYNTALTNFSILFLFLISQDQRKRHVLELVINQKDAKYNKDVKYKDDFIKHLSDVTDHNRKVNAKLQTKISNLKRDLQHTIDAGNLKTADAISKVKKGSAARYTQLKSVLKDKDELIGGLQDIAEGVASEYSAP